ncbi:hypothetical protein RJT34_20443 [Clitoria ternatea]|uniref:Uncharacterized protein n=1 Tax=Clitoria ternatea TaxID=43366 RepID=A0AAN9P4Z4_CLITE
MMKRCCRLWWPRQLLSNQESTCSSLLGWFVACSPSSLGIIVVFTCSEVLLASSTSDIEVAAGGRRLGGDSFKVARAATRSPKGCAGPLDVRAVLLKVRKESLEVREDCPSIRQQCVVIRGWGIIHDTHGSMPKFLQDKSKFSMLGLCATNPTSNSVVDETQDKKRFANCGNALEEGGTLTYRNNSCRSCCYFPLDRSFNKSSQSILGKSNWVLLMFDSPEQNNVGIHRLPQLHHIHWDGLTESEYDVHVIIYETPMYGSHHFSLSHSGSNEQAKTSTKNPKWVNELHKRKKVIELDTVILAINCTAAAKRIFESHVVPRRSLLQLSIFPMFFVIIGHLVSKSAALFSTMFYIVL